MALLSFLVSFVWMKEGGFASTSGNLCMDEGMWLCCHLKFYVAEGTWLFCHLRQALRV